MSECKKNTDIPLLGLGNVQVKNIKLSSDKKAIEVVQIDNLSVVCTMDIDSSTFIGVQIVNNNLVYTDAISNLNEELSASAENFSGISIGFSGGALNIIGAEDTSVDFSVTHVNVRYDAGTNTLIFQY